jgi:hypothetical protein
MQFLETARQQSQARAGVGTCTGFGIAGTCIAGERVLNT